MLEPMAAPSDDDGASARFCAWHQSSLLGTFDGVETMTLYLAALAD